MPAPWVPLRLTFHASLPCSPPPQPHRPSCSSMNLPKSIPASGCGASWSGLPFLFRSHPRGFRYPHIHRSIRSPPHTRSSCLPSLTAGTAPSQYIFILFVNDMDHFQSLLRLFHYCFRFMFCCLGHEAHGILVPSQGLNLRPLPWKEKSQPLVHWRSPTILLVFIFFIQFCLSFLSPLEWIFMKSGNEGEKTKNQEQFWYLMSFLVGLSGWCQQ